MFRIKAHLEKLDVELEKQRQSYNDDFESKSKAIGDHKDKVKQTIQNLQEEAKKVPNIFVLTL